ncbi:winged helix-turn-helix domain-containing tetratricopeptide repeat protein [Qipengyuania vesicularis]|uniref:winged helix-turn-helix domain-containing tetratricopeptide repeat protein n=1 Tax=Qipengyuania vesicularis TaxID=2867232 RepID=UPI001C86CA9D|nr:winged helix-turn-helix domain-containing protein [Qipengyuania vesicularis]MBX7526424.1 winged helix-turn-helix domain-containing protein [Qipengyuania vesicularis]
MTKFTFLDFDFDSLSNELRRENQPVPLRRKASLLLRVFVNNPGRIVSKEVMVEEVWNGRVVSDDAIYSQIMALRRLLDQPGGGPSVITTVHGQGFRFMPSVTRLASAELRAQDLSLQAAAETAEIDGPPIVAVLPLKWLGPTSERSNLALAIPDEIITGLQKTRYIRIIDRGSAFRFLSHDAASHELRERLAADYALSGSLEVWDDRCSISMELADLRSGRVVWTDRFEGSVAEIHAVRAEAVRGVLQNIDTVVPENEARRASKIAEDQLSAWELYHLGRSNVFAVTNKDLRTGLSRFERAMQLDPEFARAQAGITFCLWSISMVNLGDDDRPGLIRKMEEATRHALRLDPNDPFVAVATGRAMSALGHTDTSMELLTRSVKIAPASAFAHLSLASVQAQIGLFEEALDHSQLALELSPLDPNYHHICALRSLSMLGLGRFEEAATWGRRGIAFDSAPIALLAITLTSMVKSGNDEGLQKIVEEIAREYPGLTREGLKERFPIARPDMLELMTGAFERQGLLS